MSLDQSDDVIYDDVCKILQPLDLGIEDYKTIRDRVLKAILLGLQLGTRDSSSIKMFPTFVTRLPTGKGMFV